MITHKDSLQNKVKNLQKLIDELSELNIGGINIRGGVIVDMTVDSINTQNITSNNANITESLTTKNITSDYANIAASLNTSNINNSSLIETKQLKATDYMRIYGSGSYVNMKFNGQLYIDESVYLSTNKFFVQNNATFLFDTDAIIYFGKQNKNVIVGNCVNKCVCWGFLNRSSNIAIINTGYVQLNFNNEDSRWLSLLKITVNGYNLTCINYPNLSGTDDTVITTSGTDYVNGNIPTMPPITGQCDLVYFNRKRYKNHPDTDEYTTYYLFPYGQKVTYNSTAYNAYTVRYGNCNDLNTNLSSIVVRLSNVIMKW